VCGGEGREGEREGMGMGNGGSVNEEKKGDVGALQKIGRRRNKGRARVI